MKTTFSFALAIALSCHGAACLQLQGLLAKKGASTSPGSPAGAAASGSDDSPQPPPSIEATETGQTYALEGDPSSIPELVYVPKVSLDTYPHKRFGSGAHEINCASSVSREPILRLSLDEALPRTFSVVATGDRVDGVMVVKDGQMYWDCPSAIGVAPQLSNIDWTPGEYEVYAVSMKSPSIETAVFVELFDPTVPADLSKIETIALGKPLTKPKFFTVPLATNAVQLIESRLGFECRVPLPLAPDFALDVKRPLASGVIVRPLFSSKPVSMRIQQVRTGRDRDFRRCVKTTQVPNNPTGNPSYVAPSEHFIQGGFEGQFLVSLGVEGGATGGEVTFVAYDASTKLDPLTVHDALPESLPMGQRLLAYALPLLDYASMGYRDLEAQKRVAAVFRKAPERVFVYPKEDLDAQTASVVMPHHGARVDGDGFPGVDEPLLLLGYDGDHVNVIGADGVRFRTKPKRLAEAPSKRATPLAAPRPLASGLSVSELRPLVPKEGQGIIKGYERKVDKYYSCAARVASRFDEAIDREQWVIRSNTGPDVTVESRKASAIRGRAGRAIEKTCGPESKLYDLDKQVAKRLVPLVEKARARALAQANGRF